MNSKNGQNDFIGSCRPVRRTFLWHPVYECSTASERTGLEVRPSARSIRHRQSHCIICAPNGATVEFIFIWLDFRRDFVASVIIIDETTKLWTQSSPQRTLLYWSSLQCCSGISDNTKRSYGIVEGGYRIFKIWQLCETFCYILEAFYT